jgi:hypothetical protein
MTLRCLTKIVQVAAYVEGQFQVVNTFLMFSRFDGRQKGATMIVQIGQRTCPKLNPLFVPCFIRYE